MNKSLYIFKKSSLLNSYVDSSGGSFGEGWALIDLYDYVTESAQEFRHTVAESRGLDALKSTLSMPGDAYVYFTDTPSLDCIFNGVDSSLRSLLDLNQQFFDKIEAESVKRHLRNIRAQEDFANVDDKAAIEACRDPNLSPDQIFRIALIDYAKDANLGSPSKTIEEALRNSA